jgi:DNA-binding helix-hairpin-helix protein with protein kinase domain
VATLTDGQGRQVRLAGELGRGGEATVHTVRGCSDHVAKIYQPGRGYPADKLAAMLGVTEPSLRDLCAWPTDVLLHTGTFVGFLMPRITGRRPVFDLYVPKLRLQHFPTANWRFLVRAAENAARAVHHLHQAGVVIGDVNHSNFLVADDATVRAIDTDSFQITAGSQRWLCRVGTGDYQPPEMQKLTRYDGIVRTPNHDAFGLAVLVFKLLFAGRHPFSGRWTGRGDAPAIEDAIKACRYAYSQRRGTGLQPPGDALSVICQHSRSVRAGL